MSPGIDWGPLVEAAEAARKNAYAPYSGLEVGAAVLADGRVFAGCNVENASYPVGSCAERGALAAAVAAGCRKIDAVAISSAEPIPPCGMCRQALAEFNPSMAVLLAGDSGRTETSLDVLMPRPFAPGSLPQKS